MDSLDITNAQELRTEIFRMRGLKSEQKSALTRRLNTPQAVFLSARTLFPKSGASDRDLFHRDYINLISRFLIPFTLSKTLFRHANLPVKVTADLISQKAAGFITESSATKIFNKGKSLFGKLFAKNDIAQKATC